MVSVMNVINVSSVSCVILVSCVRVTESRVVICCSAIVYVVHMTETIWSEVEDIDRSATLRFAISSIISQI